MTFFQKWSILKAIGIFSEISHPFFGIFSEAIGIFSEIFAYRGGPGEKKNSTILFTILRKNYYL